MDYREADRIVTLFTLEQGKLRGIAPGARKSRRRFAGALEPFSRLQLQIAIREGLCRLQGADTVSIYPGIRRDLVKIAHAGYACELTDRFLPEGAVNQRLFRLLAAYLDQLENSPFAPSDRRFFEVNFLNILGYRPALDHCASCGADLAAATVVRFAVAGGGLLCPDCGGGVRTLERETAALLRRALASGRFGVILFQPAQLHEAGDFLDAAIATHLSQPLKSLVFLREVGAQGP
jgi:DNA repair protein RecO (recombination protein O)